MAPGNKGHGWYAFHPGCCHGEGGDNRAQRFLMPDLACDGNGTACLRLRNRLVDLAAWGTGMLIALIAIALTPPHGKPGKRRCDTGDLSLRIVYIV